MRSTIILHAAALLALTTGCAFDTTEPAPETEAAYIPPAEVEGSLGSSGPSEGQLECQRFGVGSETQALDAIEIRCAPWDAIDPEDPMAAKQTIIDPTEPEMRPMDVSVHKPH